MQRFVKAIDLALALIRPRPRNGLTILGFHGLWPEGGTEDGLVDPYQVITPSDLDHLIVTARQWGFGFVSGRDILAGWDGPAIWLTFDDGYANNLGLLPILRRHNVPATVFVTAGAIASGEAYWWDVLYREGRLRGTDPAALIRRREGLKSLPPDAIRAALIGDYGGDALRPKGKSDRPMTPEELAAFAADPLVEIGNHTQSHAILPVLSPEGQSREIRACQEYLTAVTGRTPRSIAYPNGGTDAHTLAIAAKSGLDLGVTCLPHRVETQDLLAPQGRLGLGRFMALRHGAIQREMRLACGAPGFGQVKARAQRPVLQGAQDQSHG